MPELDTEKASHFPELMLSEYLIPIVLFAAKVVDVGVAVIIDPTVNRLDASDISTS
jgi:hypothetical protein